MHFFFNIQHPAMLHAPHQTQASIQLKVCSSTRYKENISRKTRLSETAALLQHKFCSFTRKKKQVSRKTRPSYESVTKNRSTTPHHAAQPNQKQQNFHLGAWTPLITTYTIQLHHPSTSDTINHRQSQPRNLGKKKIHTDLRGAQSFQQNLSNLGVHSWL